MFLHYPGNLKFHGWLIGGHSIYIIEMVCMRQHAFIRGVTDMHPLVELVSEANAEVTYEEKDIDEVVSILTLYQLISGCT